MVKARMTSCRLAAKWPSTAEKDPHFQPITLPYLSELLDVALATPGEEELEVEVKKELDGTESTAGSEGDRKKPEAWSLLSLL